MSSTLFFIAAVALALVVGSLAAETTLKPVPQNGSSVTIEKTEVTLKQAINIVEKRRLTECVARTICELSCNPDCKYQWLVDQWALRHWPLLATAYGPKGKLVYQTLKQFESDTMPKLSYYKKARAQGLALVTDDKCADCYKLYNTCKTSTDSLLRLANSISIKPVKP